MNLNKDTYLDNVSTEDEFCLLSNPDISNYTIEQYKKDVEIHGLETVWRAILDLFHSKEQSYGVLSINNFSKLYEIGLECTSKIDKKEHGQYFTPDDVAKVMSEWLIDLKGYNICDVCCGVGSLILAYLDLIGIEEAKSMIKSSRIYLYDQDKLALYICKSTIGILYGKENLSNIHCICGDFLNCEVTLPDDCKVISNPPYFKIKNISESWEVTEVLTTTKEFYSAIMEKIIKNSESAVLITPYSFIGGSKFYSLRKIMNNYNGSIVSFDNIPGNIFIGKKHGIFNTNTTNSVRAAITIVENKEGKRGFKCSPLIRFKREERTKLLNKEVLNELIGSKYQIVNEQKKRYEKCCLELENVLDSWKEKSNQTLLDLINDKGEYKIYVPNTCRYYTVGSKKKLDRVGKITLSFDDIEYFLYAYCFINSSLCYWHWRIYDGGITYPTTLLFEMPIFFDKLSKKDKIELFNIAIEMHSCENDYLVYKKNAGALQENIKFPSHYRNRINEVLFRALSIVEPSSILDVIHSNTAFDKEVLK